MPSIGEILKNERTKKKISIDEVFLKTRITPKAITLIEENKFNEFPNPTYTKYFIRTYAKFLGINSEDIALKFDQYLKKSEPIAKEAAKEKNIRLPQKTSNFKNYFPKIASIVVIFIVFILSAVFVKNIISKIFTRKNSPIVQKAESQIKINTPKEVASKKPLLVESQKALSIPKNEDIELLIKTREPVWLKVTIDGKVIFQSELRKNSAETWRAKKSAELKIGKPEMVELFINKEPILSPRLGQNILITKEFLKVNPK